MKVQTFPARPEWEARVVDLGLTYQNAQNIPYWVDDIAVEFTQNEIERIEDATVELHHMALDAVQTIIERDWLGLMFVPDQMRQAVIDSWNRSDPYIYGRFDFAFAADGTPKMLEYNADTPTGLLESSVITWDWVEERRRQGLIGQDTDHLNGIEHALENAWKRAKSQTNALDGPVWFATTIDDAETAQTHEYMMDCARASGIDARSMDMGEIGYNHTLGLFVDRAGFPIKALCKLYPLENMAEDAFGEKIAGNPMLMIEPAWKLLLSNKALLPILWELHPNHPNLLAAAFDETPLLGLKRVRKPVFSREGGGISIYDEHGQPMEEVEKNENSPADIWQEYIELPRHENNHILVGSWVMGANPRYRDIAMHPLGGDPAGILIRLHEGLVTGNLSRSCAHYFTEDPARQPVLIPDDEYQP